MEAPKLIVIPESVRQGRVEELLREAEKLASTATRLENMNRPHWSAETQRITDLLRERASVIAEEAAKLVFDSLGLE